VAYNSGYCAVSSNGTTWTEYAMPLGTWNSIASSGTTMCTVSSDGVSAVSTNGTSWTSYSMPDNINYNCVIGASGFIAVASGPTNLAATSPDGINWSRITMPYSADWTAIGPGFSLPSLI